MNSAYFVDTRRINYIYY